MSRFLIAFIVTWIFWSSPVLSQIYKYTDENGAVRFTNDIMKVPEHLRQDVKQYEEIKSRPEDQAKPPKPVKPVKSKAPASVKKSKKSEKDNKNNKVKKEIKEEIAQLRQELKDEHKALMEEKDQIAADKHMWQKRYNTRIRKQVARGKLKELNAQEAEWETKYQAFEKKKEQMKRLQDHLKKLAKGKDSVPKKQ